MTFQSIADDFLDPERIKAMENLLAQYTQSMDFCKINLGKLAKSLQKEARSSAEAHISEAEIENAETSEEEVNSDVLINTVSSTTTGKFQSVPQCVPLGCFS